VVRQSGGTLVRIGDIDLTTEEVSPILPGGSRIDDFPSSLPFLPLMEHIAFRRSGDTETE
jgi:hypothetical protein